MFLCIYLGLKWTKRDENFHQYLNISECTVAQQLTQKQVQNESVMPLLALTMLHLETSPLPCSEHSRHPLYRTGPHTTQRRSCMKHLSSDLRIFCHHSFIQMEICFKFCLAILFPPMTSCLSKGLSLSLSLLLWPPFYFLPSLFALCFIFSLLLLSDDKF